MRRVAFAFLFGCTACSTTPETQPSPGATSSVLPPGIVAVVGSSSLREEAIVAVAKTQNVSPRRAMEGEVRDALLAVAAAQQGYENAAEVRAATRGRLARARLESLQQEAALAPVTDAEVEEATQRHFVDLARPEAFRVIHAVAIVDEKADAVLRAKAKAIAEKVAEQVASASTADEFKARAESVDHPPDIELRIEPLPPVAADGRVVDVDKHTTGDTFSLAFSRAAARLTQPGQKSGVVPTEFGFHVMMLLEKVAPNMVPLEERRRRLHDEIVTERAKRMRGELLEQLRSTTRPVVDRAAEALLGTIPVDEHEAP